jgi:signal transduction histidine kinase
LRLDGSVFTSESRGVPITWDGEAAILIIIRDITERERVEEQLRQAQKMEAVGQLTGGVAHDFNNLLTIILGNLQLIAERSEDPSVEVMAESAINASMRGSKLTQRLLAFSRKQTLAPAVIEVDRLVAGMTDLMRRTLGETIEIEAAGDDDLWICEADPSQLENAILNLALNARDAMPDGGKLIIETANVKLGEADDAAWNDVPPGDCVRVSVSDTGAGMSGEVIDHVFEPFFTTKDVGAGSGLGLSMVHGFINQSGGHVAIDSTEGVGTTVNLYLPRSSKTRATAQPSTKKKDPMSQGEKVLVVEDDPGVRELTIHMLADLGYDTFEAADGKEAIEVLQRTPGIHLLFSDVGLPGGMSGIDIAREAIKILPNIKILFTSGYADDVLSRHSGIDVNAELVHKPFRKEELAQKLRVAMGQSLN